MAPAVSPMAAFSSGACGSARAVAHCAYVPRAFALWWPVFGVIELAWLHNNRNASTTPEPAIGMGLASTGKAKRPALSSGLAVPVEARRVLKQAAVPCATKHFKVDSKGGLAQLTALLQKFNINTKAKKPNSMLAEMPRARAARGENIQSAGLYMPLQCRDWGRAFGFAYALPIQFLYALNLI